MTVYAVHEIKDDIGPARKFGDVVYVNRFYIHGDELEQDLLTGHEEGGTPDLLIPPGYRLNMERTVAKFNPEQDYLLISGDHLQLLALTAMLAVRFGSFSVLRWDRQLREYIPVRLHSGLVPPRAAVVVSGTNIGDNDVEETRRNAQAVTVESPSPWTGGLDEARLARNPRKRTS